MKSLWLQGFPGGSDGTVCLQFRRRGFNPQVRKIPWRKKWQLTPVFLPGKSHGQRSLVGYSPWGRRESDTTEQLTHTLCLQCFCNFRTIHRYAEYKQNKNTKPIKVCNINVISQIYCWCQRKLRFSYHAQGDAANNDQGDNDSSQSGHPYYLYVCQYVYQRGTKLISVFLLTFAQ